MKQINLTLVIFTLGFFLCNAQDISLKRTNTLFSNQAYVEAAASYEQHARTKEVLTNLGDAYYFIGNLAMAEKTYTELTTTHGTIQDRNRIYRYAQSLLAAKKYKQADEFLGYYHGRYYNTEAFKTALTSSKVYNYQVTALQNEGTFSDFGMRFTGANQVVFASSRNQNRPIYSWNGLPYLDLYTANIDSKGVISNVEPLKGDVNTNLHESNAVVTKDSTTVYFNRNSEDRVLIDDKKISVQRLYTASYSNGQWLDPVALPFASIDFSTQHPALSSDERTLYFASDMPGGFGKMDIYKVAINADGSYGAPVNLGASINTEQIDAFPFIGKDDILYYSTNGKQGFGGLDIFMAKMQNGTFEASTNLGDDINTAKDDHSYITKEQDNTVYFSSDRTGMDQLYAATRSENDLAKFLVDGYVKDKMTGEFLPNALVTLMDENGKVQQTATVEMNGRYEFRVATGRNYFLKGALKGYATTEELFDTKDTTTKSKTILLSLEPYDVVQARIKENERGELLINLDKIYFDYNRSVIRKDAAVILDDLVRIMNLYPDMNIEVSAHTDSRGPSGYNLTLSKDRAASVVKYLTTRGIKETRLQSTGYGEEKLLNDCNDDKKCTEEQHENNRRCEFKIID